MFGKKDEDKQKEEDLKKAEEEKKKMEEEDKKKKEEEMKKAEEEKKKLEEEEKKRAGEKNEDEPEEKPPEKKQSPSEGLGNMSSVGGKPPEQPDQKPPAPKKEESPEEKPGEKKTEKTISDFSDDSEDKGPDPEVEKLKSQLERQRQSMKDLEEERENAVKKSEELTGLVEDLSSEIKDAKNAPPPQQAAPQAAPAPDITPKIKEMEERTGSEIKALKEMIESMAKKKEEEKKGEEDVATTMKKMFDKRMKELSEKLEDVKAKPAPGTQEGAAEGASPGGEGSGGLAAMGGGVDFTRELDNIKKSLKDMATLVDAFKEESENRFMAIDREMEIIERVPEIEDKVKMLQRKLGAENVDKLRHLISAADELKDEVIPLVAKREVEKKIEPFSKEMKNLEDSLEKADKKMEAILSEFDGQRKDIKQLYKFENRISGNEETLNEVKKLIAELRMNMRDLDKNQRADMEEKMKELFPKMLESEASQLRKEFSGRFAFIDDKLQSVENMFSESQKELAALSALKGSMESAGDRMDDMQDNLEKIGTRIDTLKERDADLKDKLEKMETPKEVITQLENKTKDILDIREFFVRRADGLEERINQLDERAVPTQKLHDKVDSLIKSIKELEKMYKEMDDRTKAEKQEFQALLDQHAEEKKMLEDRLAEQKNRIAVLLKEFR